MDFIFFVLGCLLLWFGGNGVVDGATGIARRFNVSELVIGLTLVAIGTSLPEIFVNIIASLNNEHDVVLGNILGSNISNSCLILGATGVICPLIIPNCRMNREIQYYFLCLIALACVMLSATEINALFGSALFIFFIISIVLFFLPKPSNTEYQPNPTSLSLFKSIAICTTGCAVLPLGGHYLISSAISIATGFGFSKAFISLFAVALGTSLPELVTSVLAAKKGNTQIALGNILGSNIFNITLVLAISSWINPIKINPLFYQDLLIVTVASIPLAFILLKSKRTRLSSLFSYGMLLFYLGYCIFIYMR